jgi:tRNA uridine 5-carboxymethylaminomethyl modification enzyme
MSCNPSIGGLAKGHLTREIDALGGVQARATDATGIQFRLLNTSKGPAVQAPRAQCDKLAYNAWMRDFMNAHPRITVAGGMATGLIFEHDEHGRKRVGGVTIDDGSRVRARAVICTTGTFLDGLIHIGLKHFPAGRFGEQAAVGLADSFREAGLETGRLKTGTPPRLRAGSIDYSKFEPQQATRRSPRSPSPAGRSSASRSAAGSATPTPRRTRRSAAGSTAHRFTPA